MTIPVSFCEDESQIEDKFETDVLNLRESLSPKFPVPGAQNMELLNDISEETSKAPAFCESRPPSTRYTTPKTSPKTQRRTTMFVTPRNKRRSTLLPSIIAASAARFGSEFLADLSLPDESIEMDESNFSPFVFDGKLANSKSKGGTFQLQGFIFMIIIINVGTDDDAFSEGHSMTVRDILLRAGADDDSFDIVGKCNNPFLATQNTDGSDYIRSKGGDLDDISE